MYEIREGPPESRDLVQDGYGRRPSPSSAPHRCGWGRGSSRCWVSCTCRRRSCRRTSGRRPRSCSAARCRSRGPRAAYPLQPCTSNLSETSLEVKLWWGAACVRTSRHAAVPLAYHVRGIPRLLQLARDGRHVAGDAGAGKYAADVDLVDVVWQPARHQAGAGGRAVDVRVVSVQDHRILQEVHDVRLLRATAGAGGVPGDVGPAQILCTAAPVRQMKRHMKAVVLRGRLAGSDAAEGSVICGRMMAGRRDLTSIMLKIMCGRGAASFLAAPTTFVTAEPQSSASAAEAAALHERRLPRGAGVVMKSVRGGWTDRRRGRRSRCGAAAPCCERRRQSRPGKSKAQPVPRSAAVGVISGLSPQFC